MTEESVSMDRKRKKCDGQQVLFPFQGQIGGGGHLSSQIFCIVYAISSSSSTSKMRGGYWLCSFFGGVKETSKTPRIMTALEEDGIGTAKKKKKKGRKKKRKTIAQGQDLKKEENIRKKEENIRKKEENIRKKEENIRKKEENIGKKEENIGKKEEDIRKIVEHITKLKADEACDKAFFMKLLQKDSTRLDKMMEELVECQADLKKDQEDLKKDQAALEKAQVHNW